MKRQQEAEDKILKAGKNAKEILAKCCQDLPPEIPSEKNGSHTPYNRRRFFCRFGFSSQGKLPA